MQHSLGVAASCLAILAVPSALRADLAENQSQRTLRVPLITKHFGAVGVEWVKKVKE